MPSRGGEYLEKLSSLHPFCPCLQVIRRGSRCDSGRFSLVLLPWAEGILAGVALYLFFNSLVFVSPDLDLCKINTRPLHSTSQLRTSPSISMSQVSNTWQALGQGGGYYKQKNHFTCSLCFVPVMLVFIMSLVRWQVGVSANTNQKTGKAVWKAQSVAANQWHWFEILLYSVSWNFSFQEMEKLK